MSASGDFRDTLEDICKLLPFQSDRERRLAKMVCYGFESECGHGVLDEADADWWGEKAVKAYKAITDTNGVA